MVVRQVHAPAPVVNSRRMTDEHVLGFSTNSATGLAIRLFDPSLLWLPFMLSSTLLAYDVACGDNHSEHPRCQTLALFKLGGEYVRTAHLVHGHHNGEGSHAHSTNTFASVVAKIASHAS